MVSPGNYRSDKITIDYSSIFKKGETGRRKKETGKGEPGAGNGEREVPNPGPVVINSK